MDILKSLDIALAMIVVYLVFALGVTAANECLASMLNSRARWLRKGVAALLTPPKGGGVPAAATTPADAVFESAYISALGQASGLWSNRFPPSYVPPWTLVQAMLDAVAQTKGSTLATFAEVDAAVKKLPDGSPIKVALTNLIAQAGSDLAQLQTRVEAWFKTFEEQVTAWYRQKTQLVVLVLSLLVACGMNLDTVAMVQALSTDAKLRATLVDKALDAAAKGNASALLDVGPLQRAEAAAKQGRDANKPADEQARLDAAVATERNLLDRSAQALVSGMASTGLPMGWGGVDAKALGGIAWLQKVVGLLLTAFALSLGAPFWFDLLQKLASIRAVGKNLPERAQPK